MDDLNDIVDFDDFHRVELPQRLAAGHGVGAAGYLGSQSGATSLALRPVVPTPTARPVRRWRWGRAMIMLTSSPSWGRTPSLIS
jgi:hypothetical protein